MNINEFAICIKDGIVDYLPEQYKDAKVTVCPTTKNNGRKLTGLSVKSPDCEIAPCVYIDSAYDDYKNGSAVEEIMANISRLIIKSDASHEFGKIDVESFLQFDLICDHIKPRLINTKSNKELLADAPHKTIEDLSVVYYLHLNEGGSITIRDNLFNSWNISVEELHKVAVANLIKEGTKFKSLNEVLGFGSPDDADMGMYVLSNTSGTFGAAALLDEGSLNRIADSIGDTYYVIPSSIHETIIVKIVKGLDIAALRNMICDVNANVVALEDRLSDNLYIYSRDEGLRIAE